MDFIIPRFLYWQLLVQPQLPQTDFAEQTIIVTGANSGLGLETARHLVRMKAKRVIIACRTLSKGEAAKSSIEESTGRQGVVQVWKLDLCSYASVQEFAARAQTLDRLDAVIENAGIQPARFEMAEEDESTITTNVVSTFFLALLMLPKLRESAAKFDIAPRLTVVSSDLHFVVTLEAESKGASIFEHLNDKSKAEMGAKRYSISKLLEVLYCRELAPRMNGPDKPFVILNYLTPGLCHSNLAERFFLERILLAVLARKTDIGACTLVTGAAAGKESHGRFMCNGSVLEPSVYVRSERGATAGKRVWSELNEKLEKIRPGVTRNV